MAMRSDGFPAIQPSQVIRREESSSEVVKFLDGITNNKAASVIRMFFPSLSAFHKGLKIYSSKSTSNPDGVTNTQHFYKALAADEDDVLEENYSVVDMSESRENIAVVFVERIYNNRRIRFSQDAEANIGERWQIPITYASKVNPSSGNTKPKFWLTSRELEIYLGDVRPNSYFLVNPPQVGYYRVLYDEANWMLIADELSSGNFSSISTISRAHLIEDSAAFSEQNILKVRIFLDLIKYLRNEVR